MKIGNKVKIDKFAATSSYSNGQYPWYSDEVYTIMNVSYDVATLDRNLRNHNDSKIHISYLKLLSADRKDKLLNLQKL